MFEANTQTLTDQLPSVDHITFERIDPAYRRVSLITVMIIMLILLISFGVALYLIEGLRTPVFVWIFVTIWTLITVFWVYLVYQDYHTTGYAIRDKDLVYKSGIFYRNMVVVPFNRVQHCEISQGPVSRYFGLSSLTVYTAGGSSSDVDIDGLTTENAYKLKQFLTTKISVDEEE
jgi:uncharacterized protein